MKKEEKKKSLIFVALRLNCTYKNNQITLNTQNTYIKNCKLSHLLLLIPWRVFTDLKSFIDTASYLTRLCFNQIAP